jgi:tetratricopeptide (TPR) repeat protein
VTGPTLTPSEAALLQAEAGDVEGAVSLLRREMSADEHDAGLGLALGSILLHAKRLDEAVAALREAVEEDEDSPVARALYARALEETGKPDDAIFQLLRAAKLAPDDAPVLRELGGAFYRKGLYDKALQWLLKARAAAAGDAKEEARALYAVGLAQEARRDTGAAIAAYRSAIEKDPRHLDARKTLVDALASIGEHERAIAAVDELLALDRTNEKVALNREVLERALREMQARRLIGKGVKELEMSAIVSSGQLKRKGRGLLGRVADAASEALLKKTHEPQGEARHRYGSALLELYVTLHDGAIGSLFLAIADPEAANQKRDNAFQVTVVAKDGRREPASYATAASLTFLREAMGMPMTRAAELYGQLLSGTEAIEYGGLAARFAMTEGEEGTSVNGLLVTPRDTPAAS